MPKERWVAVTLAAAVAAGALACRLSKEESAPVGPLAGYVSDARVLRAEALRFGGKADAEAVERARKLGAAGEYPAAIEILAPVAAASPIPAVHTNLGLLFAAAGDAPNAREAFLAALRVDPGYRAAREALARLPEAKEEAPLTRELEPNDAPWQANAIALGARVSASAGAGDVDCFRFRAPERRRDVLEIAVVNRSAAFEPALRLLDPERRIVDLAIPRVKPGANLTARYSSEPGAHYCLEVWGRNRTEGEYAVEVRALEAFDRWEPNDDIAHAAEVARGVAIEAGIMDARDTDYYRVEGSASGEVTVRVENRSAMLAPALAFHGADRRLLGFGPEGTQPGADVSHTLRVLPGERCYVQVWGRAGSSGPYVLTVR